MRYLVELSYDGAAYCGWQRQPNVVTIQQTIEQALSKLLRTPTEIVGAGRTDTGVNASYYIAHFDAIIEDCEQTLYKLNRMLPDDIAIKSIKEVRLDFHARYDAIEREYSYFITHTKNPFWRSSSWLYYPDLDVESMNEAAQLLLDYTDFTSFAKLNSNNHTNICHIKFAKWSIESDGILKFTIRADRFLRNMVRAIVGTIVDVGRGKYSIAEFREIIEAKDLARSSAGAPAQGLFLSDVVYKL